MSPLENQVVIQVSLVRTFADLELEAIPDTLPRYCPEPAFVTRTSFLSIAHILSIEEKLHPGGTRGTEAEPSQCVGAEPVELDRDPREASAKAFDPFDFQCQIVVRPIVIAEHEFGLCTFGLHKLVAIDPPVATFDDRLSGRVRLFARLARNRLVR